MEHFLFQYVGRLTFLRCLFIPIDDILSTSTLYLLFFYDAIVLFVAFSMDTNPCLRLLDSYLNVKWLRGTIACV